MTYATGSSRDRTGRRTLPALLLAASLLLSGCALITPGANTVTLDPAIDGSNRTLDTAKNEYFAVLDEISALVDPSELAETYPQRTTSGVLFDCGPPDQYYWPGGRGGILSNTADPAAIIDRIETHFSAQAEWTVTRLTDRDRTPTPVRLQRDDGVFITVAMFDGGTRLDINGFSACFTLTDYNPNKQY